MAARQGTLNRRVSDLVVESRIEATWDPRSGQTTQIRTAVGTSARQRRLKTEETWSRKRVLGNGAFGTVWLEESTATDGSGSSDQIPKLRAVKEIQKRPNEPVSDFHRELEAMAKFSHERFVHCFVRSFGWFENDTHLFIAMEYLKHGDLQRYLAKPFPEPEARQVVLQVVEALDFMHGSDFVHRDLKPGNILVFQKGPAWWVKIGDFGISKRVEGSAALTTMEIGTRGYMAPEMLGIYPSGREEGAGSGSAITLTIDMWAVGEIAHRKLTHKSAFKIEGDVWSYVKEGTSFPVHELKNIGASTHSIRFIQEAMAAASRNRLTAEEAMKHAWLRSHEFIEETESRSSTESNGEMTPTDLALLLREVSGEWTTEVKTPGTARDKSNDTSIAPAIQESPDSQESLTVERSAVGTSPGVEDDPAFEESPGIEEGSEADDGTPASPITQPTDNGHRDEPVVLQKPRQRRRNVGVSVADASESSTDLKPGRRPVHKASINEPKLLQTDQDALQGLVLPEQNAIQSEQRKHEL
ncbi:hypothetical protein QQZ08_005444 [Neonectria magnoliae]|uniref:mitogen-activated protein kinase kinase n=1 Tax=Neonectria magnoliae TaxID=2732573 RepID=A0ABR1I524_9HYPO